MAKFDFGITLEEFGRATPGMFMALMKRQNVEFRHNCYLAGITASIVANVNRANDEARIWTAIDFVPDRAKETRRDKLKSQIHATFGAMLEFNSSPEAMDAARKTIIERLTKAGNEDVEEVFNEVFPHWEQV
jgi:hypothetical protein